MYEQSLSSSATLQEEASTEFPRTLWCFWSADQVYIKSAGFQRSTGEL